MLLTSHSKVWK